MDKACPNHGPIDWPLTALTCPACGEELEAYDNDLLMGLWLAPSPPPPATGAGTPGAQTRNPEDRR